MDSNGTLLLRKRGFLRFEASCNPYRYGGFTGGFKRGFKSRMNRVIVSNT